MKTFLSGIAALLTGVVALATDIIVPPTLTNTLESIHVGDIAYFRAEGVKEVRKVHISAYGNLNPNAKPIDEFGSPNGFEGWQIASIGWGYTLPEEKVYTEAELLQFGKASLADYASTFGDPGALYYVRVQWDGGTDTIGFTVFRDVVNFRLERDSKGELHPPAWATENLRMKAGDNVFMRVPGVRNVRLRWWDGKEFQDSDAARDIPVSLTSTKQSFIQGPNSVAVDPETGIISLPAKPLLERATGILTFASSDANGKPVWYRYHTGTGMKLAGVQGEREPIILAIRYDPADAWKKAGIILDYSFDAEMEKDFVIEKSDDWKSWTIFPYTGERITAPSRFYRARYKQ